MHPIIDDLNWRYATQKFDASKKVSTADFETIKESLRLTPSSYGLQPLHYLVITSPEIREDLKVASFDQSQIVDASHLIVICAFKELNESHIDDHINNIAETRNLHPENAEGFGNYMKNAISKLSPEEKINWNSKQAYIALGQLLHTCASLRIDATPMEGFVPEQYNEILGLDAQNLTAVLVCPIGYRHADDQAQFQSKVRKRQTDIFGEV